MSEHLDNATYTTSIPLSAVRVRSGNNPRRRFDQEDHDGLCLTLREEGLMHPIAVRQLGNEEFEIIAGERRWRAAKAIGWASIDAKVFICSAQQARRMARIENLKRVNLSVPEEAYLAQDQLDDCEGDYEQTTRVLGWTVAKLRHRLQLLHASALVMDALMDKVIQVGHAELLSTLPTEKQDDVLAKVIGHRASVAQLREQLQGVSIPLAQAKFDLDGCCDCPHNSSQQSSLFAEHIEAARCTNSSCFSTKTVAWVDARREELKDDYAVVELRTEVMPGKTIPLVMQGEYGVGKAQYAQCRGCAFRTCVLDNMVGKTTGNVEGPLCGNAGCNNEKVAAYKSASAPTAKATVPLVEPAKGGSQLQQGLNKRSASTADQENGSLHQERSSQPVAIPKAAKLAYQAVVRRGAAHIVPTEPRVLLALAAYGLFQLGRSNSGLPDSVLPPKVRAMTGSSERIGRLLLMEKGDLQSLLVDMASQFLTENPENYVRDVDRSRINRVIVNTFEVDMAPHVTVNKEFLACHTIPAIHLVLDESGFATWHKAQPEGEKKHKALLALDKKKLIDGVLKAGFDFSGYVPSGVRTDLVAKD
ncbi:PRTRC system ParB family protein [Xanthomonas vesicatoria]|uniref:PRTRC system ParB family protein n=1 Tax=Xanthomonas vesicatoria TaxID=56460 RepID=UPI001E31D64B|nr:PRTRC system ParB family protein [Xanthomonas vesicatoria]MCC8630160.1 PRTRC system ParB family protein [Xanthomonas vesicatoria]